MAHAVETMAYTKSGGLPWHGLGFPVDDKMTPKQMQKAAGLDWTVSKRPVFIKPNGKPIEVPGQYAVYRDDKEEFFSMVGEIWKPVQNEEALDFFSKYVKAGHMHMETAGSLHGGRHIWGLAKVNADFKLGKGDEVKSYLLLTSAHVFGISTQILFTPIRVVCNNTLTWALRAGKNETFRVLHRTKFDDAMKKNAEASLGFATAQVEEFKEAATILSKKKATEAQTEDYFCKVLKFDPKEAQKKKDGEAREPQMLPLFRTALTHAPGAQMNTALGTWWGALNAVTYVIDHEVGKERDTALKAAWIGYHAPLKRDAFTLAVEAAKKARAT